MISRRKMLALGAGAAIAGAFGLYKYLRGDPKEIVLSILQRRVGYLRVDPASFDDFAAHYVTSQKEHERRLGAMSVIAWPFRYISPYAWVGQGSAFRRLEDSVVSNYLLSTDFFQHGADEQRQITYLSYHDPDTAACRHPFIRG